jgi:hypothetical protein
MCFTLAAYGMTALLFTVASSGQVCQRALSASTAAASAALQAVLSLSGYGDDDTHNWGRMRVLTNFKLIKRLTELKPGETPKKV